MWSAGQCKDLFYKLEASDEEDINTKINQTGQLPRPK